jgi:hypothetical protein
MEAARFVRAPSFRLPPTFFERTRRFFLRLGCNDLGRR